jgi:hypothetical protein
MDAQGDPVDCTYQLQRTSSTFSPTLTNYSPSITTAGTVNPHHCIVTTINLNESDRCVSTYPGIEVQESWSEISVFPNPTSGEITIGKSTSEPISLSHIEICDLSGNLISCIEGPIKDKLNVDFLPNGIYLVSALDGSKKYSFKLVVSHN